MRRRLLISLGLMALPAAGAAPAFATSPGAGLDPPPASAAAPLPASAGLVDCQSALAQPERYARFSASMRSLRPGNRMEIRFDLLERRPGERSFSAVAAPGLGAWKSARRGVSVYRYRKVVENLAAPASYRALVRFRWKTSEGRVFAATRRLTPVCAQRDLRPNLRPGAVTAEPTPDGGARYFVVVRNIGRTGTGAFKVVLGVDGADRPPRTVFGLPAGQRRVRSFLGPRCRPGDSVSVVLDPAGDVPEADEDDNARLLPCPLP